MFRVGILYRLPDLIGLVQAQSLTVASFLQHFPQWHDVPSVVAVETGVTGGWLSRSPAGDLCATEAGLALRTISSPQARLREQIARLIEVASPAWAALVHRGRETVCVYAPGEAVQCLREAGLLDGIDTETVAWWDRLSSASRSRQDAGRLRTGRRGERLSWEYELERTGTAPEWKALDTVEAGYDLLSIVERGSTRRLLIEVKSSTMDQSRAVFWITRHEWKALNGADAAAVHLWTSVGAGGQLTVVPASELGHHIPHDQGLGTWETVAIPFRTFAA